MAMVVVTVMAVLRGVEDITVALAIRSAVMLRGLRWMPI